MHTSGWLGSHAVISAAMTVKRYTPMACYFTPRQTAGLRKLSKATGAPVTHYVRLAVDEFLMRHGKKKRSRHYPLGFIDNPGA